MLIRFAICLGVLIGPSIGFGQTVLFTIDDPRMKEILEPIRKKHNLPAMAAALVTGQGLEIAGAVGLRKVGADVPAPVRRGTSGWRS